MNLRPAPWEEFVLSIVNLVQGPWWGSIGPEGETYLLLLLLQMCTGSSWLLNVYVCTHRLSQLSDLSKRSLISDGPWSMQRPMAGKPLQINDS